MGSVATGAIDQCLLKLIRHPLAAKANAFDWFTEHGDASYCAAAFYYQV